MLFIMDRGNNKKNPREEAAEARGDRRKQVKKIKPHNDVELNIRKKLSSVRGK